MNIANRKETIPFCALKVVSKCAGVFANILYSLYVDLQRVADNYEVSCEKWCEEKATGVIIRNPSILAVQTRGYGSSAEVAGEDTVVLSMLLASQDHMGKVFSCC